MYDVTRVEWGALPPSVKPYPTFGLSDVDGVEFHHAGSGPRTDSMFSRIQVAQRNAGKWGGDIFYHVGVSTSGKIWELRGLHRNVGAVTWLVRKRLTVLFLGDSGTFEPNDAQVQAVRRVREAVRDAGGGTKVFYHGDRAATACPGKGVRAMELLPLRPKVEAVRLDEVPAIGHWTGGRFPMWVPLSDGRVLLENGAPAVETLREQGVDRLATPIVWAFFDPTTQRLVLVAEGGGTFALGVKT